MSSPFVRKLQREITGNPKKTGVLALLLIVAIWFWVPLVAKWCGLTEAAAPAGVVAAADPATANAAPTAPSAAAPAPSRRDPWQLVAGRLDKDERMKSAVDFGKWRDPFGPSATELAATEQAAADKRKQEQTPKVEKPNPTAAGLVLTSTIFRAVGSVAMINGTAYHEGSLVPAGESGSGFTLVEIRPRQVILARDGQRYELHLDTIEIARPGGKSRAGE